MAQLNPFRFLRTAAKNSPWLVIAIALHAVAIAVLSLVYLASTQEPGFSPDVNISQATRPLEVIEPPEVIEERVPPKNVDEEIVEIDRPVEYTPTDIPPDLTLERGDSQSESSGPATGGDPIGAGEGPGSFSPQPGPYGGRGDNALPQGGREGGATQPTEKAVRDGLLWLIRHQQADGSWDATALPGCCVNDRPCVAATEHFPQFWQQGLTGLSLLAFLGAGYNFDSKQTIVDTVQAKQYRIGEVVKQGLKWLKSHQLPDGSFGPDQHVYNQALCALALTEAYGASKNRAWQEPAQRAIDWLVRAQKLNPESDGESWGWRYHSRADVQLAVDQLDGRMAALAARRAPLEAEQAALEIQRSELEARREQLKPREFALELQGLVDRIREVERGLEALRPEQAEIEAGLRRVTPELYDSDLSVTTWVIMAFKSAGASGLEVPRAGFLGGKRFALSTSTDDGQAGYLSRSGAGRPVSGEGDQFEYHHGTLSALSMLCRTFVDRDIDDPYLERGAKQLIRDLPEVSKDRLSIDYYYWYYASLALNQFDGPDSPRKGSRYWAQWNHAMQAAVLGTQDDTEKACTHGGWIAADRWSLQGGPIYATAINVLTLEVYYRYPNAFK